MTADIENAPAHALGDWQRPTAYRAAIGLIEMISAALLVGIIGVVFVSVFFRYVLNSPILYSDELASMMFLWLIMFGAVLALDRGQHLRLMVVVNMLSEKRQKFLEVMGLFCVGIFLSALVMPAVEHVAFEWNVTSVGLGISMGYRVAAFPVGICLMLAVVLFRLFAIRDLVAGLLSMVALCAVAFVFWQLMPVFYQLGQLNILLLLVSVIAFCLVIGVPIGFCFGLGSIVFLMFSTHMPLSVVLGRMDEGMSGLVLLSVPVFLLLGTVLDHTGMGRAIVDFLAGLLGHAKAGLSYVMLGALFLVSGISGSKFSDMATVAPALFPEMRRRGNKPSEMVALLGSGAIMADTVPPSIILIVVGSITGISIGALFASGFVVAIFLLLTLGLAARWRARHETMEGVKRAPMRMLGRLLIIAIPALALPFLIRGAVVEGIATATEVSTFAVVYALIAGSTIYGRIGLRQLYGMLVDTAIMTGAILIILGTASAAAWALTQTGFAQSLLVLMEAVPGGWVVFMLVTIVTFIGLGCLLEGIPALVIMAPMMFPIAQQLGIHPVHYAMIVVVAMNIGMFLPPVGIGFYIAASMGQVKPETAMRASWFYLFILSIGLLILAFVPWISLVAL